MMMLLAHASRAEACLHICGHTACHKPISTYLITLLPCVLVPLCVGYRLVSGMRCLNHHSSSSRCSWWPVWTDTTKWHDASGARADSAYCPALQQYLPQDSTYPKRSAECKRFWAYRTPASRLHSGIKAGHCLLHLLLCSAYTSALLLACMHGYDCL